MIFFKKNRTFWPAIVIILFIFLHFSGILSPLENLTIKSLNPVSSWVYSYSSVLKQKWNDQASKQNYAEIIRQLEEEKALLASENVRLSHLEEENEKLRQHLKFFTNNNFSYLMANVISQGLSLEPQEQEENVIINKGSSDGLESGLAVVNPGGIIIGKIIAVEENISKIALVTNVNCQLAGSLKNSSKNIGLTEGQMGLTIKMNYIPQSEVLKVGDLIITSGLEERIPAGLLIGEISQINSQNNEVWQSAVIEPFSTLNDLSIVSVILKE